MAARRSHQWSNLVIEPIPSAQMRLRRKVDEPTHRFALRATLTAAHLLGLAVGAHLRALRAVHDPLAALQGRLQEAELRATLAWEILELQNGRFSRLAERKRPHFTPAQRFRITEIKNLLGWSAVEMAKALLFCPNTILNWERSADPQATTAGSTVQPVPPIRRAAEVVRATIQTLTRLGFGGEDMMARVLARAGWRVSARPVARYPSSCLAPPASNRAPRVSNSHCGPTGVRVTGCRQASIQLASDPAGAPPRQYGQSRPRPPRRPRSSTSK
jgi:hypothetical protein